MRKIQRLDTLCALAVVALMAPACSGSSSSVTSGPGETCARTADCQTGLTCVASVCGSGNRPADAGAPTMDAGGTMIVGYGDASPGSSHIGQACQTTRDCASGLACIASAKGASVCDVESFGVTPSTKTCTGECGVAADCCELPAGLGVSAYGDGGYVYAQNCQDIFVGILGGSTAGCSGAGATTYPMSTACFFYETYCACAAGTWACTGGSCVYAASCQGQPTNEPGGCPSETRSGTTLNTTCDTSTHTCPTSSCTTGASCDGRPVVDRGGVVCRGGDCTCQASACYLKCARDLDCASGYSCDGATSVCMPSPCTSDATCFSQLGMARAKCSAGACEIPCAVDLDCSPSGDLAGQPFNGTVCGPAGVCVSVGCSSDVDCASGGTGARRFCVAGANANVHSAVSN